MPRNTAYAIDYTLTIPFSPFSGDRVKPHLLTLFAGHKPLEELQTASIILWEFACSAFQVSMKKLILPSHAGGKTELYFYPLHRK